jgi:TyrR family helix-turn-helix protein
MSDISLEDLLEALDASPDGLFIYDSDLRLIYANASAMEECRLDSFALRKKWTELKSTGYFSGTAALDAHFYKKPSSSEFITSTGAHLYCVATPVLDNKGDIKCIVSNVKNIISLNMMREDLLRDQSSFLKNTFLYKSQKLKNIIKLAEKVAKTDFAVTIRGETGVGKSDLAEFIHNLSLNSELPFIAINCGAIAPTLCDAEFFGYEKGAFTGANQSKAGIFETANNGTLFLDEIGELPLFMQVKLLRVLQKKKVKRLGSNKEVSVNFRIITATNKNIKDMIQKNKFREDLFYRLNGIDIEIPPLRERKDDVKMLISYFLQRFNIKHFTTKTLSPNLLEFLENYMYPGNVRELAYIIERLIILSPGNVIEKQHFSHNGLLATKSDEVIPLKTALENAEKELLIKAKQIYKTTRAMGKALGVSHVTVAQKLKRYDIS